MTLRADSPEFAHLLDRWLDDSATPEQAELFWRCVTDCPDCALEFAAAARFEGLLADTIKARDVEAEARKILAVTPRSTAPSTARMIVPAAAPRPVERASLRVFAIAAGLVVAGLITAMLWPSDPVTPEVAHSPKAPVKPIAAPELPKLEKPTQAPMPALETPALAAGTVPQVEVTLVERLDRFFINGVVLENMPLGQALALLQQQLVQTDYLKTLSLNSLRVTVPAGATARRVSFQSTSIPYLKAVRAVAALAGCDVQVDGMSITLILQPGTFPQVVERRTLGELLAGRLTREGTAVIEDAGRVTALWEDAALLGIAIAEDGTANLSRGQWEALRMMTDARDQMGIIPLPTFALYVVPQESVPQEGVLTPDQTLQFQQNAGQAGIQPVASVTPNLAAPQDDILMASATGNDINIGPEPDVGTNFTGGILRGTGAVLTLDSAGTVSAGLVMNSTNLVIRDQAVMAAINAIQNTGSAAVIIAVPVQPTTPP